MIPMIGTFDQIVWWSGCVCWIAIGAMIASTNPIGYWTLDLCEGLHTSYVTIPTRLEVGCALILNLLWSDSK
jgi:hypothetical protein